MTSIPAPLVPVGLDPDSVPPLSPLVTVANVPCAFGASVSATARGWNVIPPFEVTDVGMVERRDVTFPEVVSTEGPAVRTLPEFVGSPLLDASGTSVDVEGFGVFPDARGIDAVPAVCASAPGLEVDKPCECA